MKWEGNRQSDNVEDRRSGGGAPIFGGRNIGIGTIVVALVGGWVLGINPLTLLGVLSGGGGAIQSSAPAQKPAANDTMASFVSTVLADASCGVTQSRHVFHHSHRDDLDAHRRDSIDRRGVLCPYRARRPESVGGSDVCRLRGHGLAGWFSGTQAEPDFLLWRFFGSGR